MIEFIAQYWLEVLLGLISTGLGALCKYFYGLYKKEKNREKADENAKLTDNFKQFAQAEHNELLRLIEENKAASDKTDQMIKADMEATKKHLSTLQKGVLGIQGRDFKSDCRFLLEHDHVITQNEWEEINDEHDIYNSLGGNHEGDRLYNDVSIKYHDELTK